MGRRLRLARDSDSRLLVGRLVALVILVALAGCGGAGTSGAERAAGQTVSSWLEALVAGDNARACSQLTPALRAAINRRIRLIRVEPGDCYDWAAKWIGRTKPPGRRDAQIESVAISGGVATVTVTAPPDLESEVRLRQVAGRWRIDDY